MELLILCIKIFMVRIIDVSLGTLRTMITVKGKKVYASLIGFFEVLIWFLIVREALNTDSTSIFVAIAYAGGFATGTYIGGVLSSKFINGNLGLQVITEKAYPDMVERLREEGYAVTVMDVEGKDKNQKYMLFIEINKKSYEHIHRIIKDIDPMAFTVANESAYIQNGFIKK